MFCFIAFLNQHLCYFSALGSWIGFSPYMRCRPHWNLILNIKSDQPVWNLSQRPYLCFCGELDESGHFKLIGSLLWLNDPLFPSNRSHMNFLAQVNEPRWVIFWVLESVFFIFLLCSSFSRWPGTKSKAVSRHKGQRWHTSSQKPHVVFGGVDPCQSAFIFLIWKIKLFSIFHPIKYFIRHQQAFS